MKKHLRVSVCKGQERSIATLYQLYLRDLSKFTGSSLDKSELHLKKYIGHQARVMIKFVIDSEIIGFALVSFAGFDTASHSIDDFFILKKYRGRGYGKLAARTILSRRRGRWTISQIAKNRPAILFWRAVVERHYTRLSEHIRRNEYLRSNVRVTQLHTASGDARGYSGEMTDVEKGR